MPNETFAEWNQRAQARGAANETLPRIVVTEGWNPDPPLFGAGQVIRVVWSGAPVVATVVSGSSFGDVRLYLPDTGEWVECVLVREMQPASNETST